MNAQLSLTLLRIFHLLFKTPHRHFIGTILKLQFICFLFMTSQIMVTYAIGLLVFCMLSSIFPNFKKFTTSVADHVPNTKIAKTLQIRFFMYKILVLQQSGTSLQLPMGRICDGVGGTVKRLATRASLQRPLDSQIITNVNFLNLLARISLV